MCMCVCVCVCVVGSDVKSFARCVFVCVDLFIICA